MTNETMTTDDVTWHEPALAPVMFRWGMGWTCLTTMVSAMGVRNLVMLHAGIDLVPPPVRPLPWSALADVATTEFPSPKAEP